MLQHKAVLFVPSKVGGASAAVCTDASTSEACLHSPFAFRRCQFLLELSTHHGFQNCTWYTGRVLVQGLESAAALSVGCTMVT